MREKMQVICPTTQRAQAATEWHDGQFADGRYAAEYDQLQLPTPLKILIHKVSTCRRKVRMGTSAISEPLNMRFSVVSSGVYDV
ncbi:MULTISPECIES: hypothetical protein [unclassified Bradyrhizobium]|uniref:hypothetical protein n=1 Tax=unclassified Bradyrhizobium TaxID=2631580 RepID=UPI002916D9D7|nr:MULTISPECIES: hypothetical protein [unclassified Bradyrhizobium]